MESSFIGRARGIGRCHIGSRILEIKLFVMTRRFACFLLLLVVAIGSSVCIANGGGCDGEILRQEGVVLRKGSVAFWNDVALAVDRSEHLALRSLPIDKDIKR